MSDQAHAAPDGAGDISRKQSLNALQIFHVNINCSDLDGSRAFYEAVASRS